MRSSPQVIVSKIFALGSVALLLGCDSPSEPATQVEVKGAAPIQVEAPSVPLIEASAATIEAISFNSGASSMAPHITSDGADSGAVIVSWIEEGKGEGRHRGGTLHWLRIDEKATVLEQGQLAEDPDMFINWADVPVVTRVAGANAEDAPLWIATWGRRNKAEGDKRASGYIAMWASSSNGKDWSEAQPLHEETKGPEFGFVSLASVGGGRVASVWLDSRASQGGHGEKSATGGMQLRGRILPEGKELLLDERVCDCCGTALVVAPDSDKLWTVYRDRDADEIRDIMLTSWGVDARDGEGLARERSQVVGTAGWRIEGCPVNGPAAAISASGEWMALAGFSGAQAAHVQLSFAELPGVGADKAALTSLILDRSKPIGRMDVAIVGEASALVSWMGAGPDPTGDSKLRRSRWLAQVVTREGKQGRAVELVSMANSRASGFPRLMPLGEQILLAWTAVDKNDSGDELTHLRLGLLSADQLAAMGPVVPK